MVKLTVPIVPIALQKSGIIKILTRIMVYSSRQYHGLGLLYPWYNQQLKHLQIVVGKTTNRKPTGQLIQITAGELCSET